MEMEFDVIVLSAKRYSISGESGEVVKGVTVSYIMNDNLTATTVDSDTFGYIPAKYTAPFEDFEKFKVCPGLYKMSCAMTVTGGVGGKVTMKPVSCNFKKALDLKSK